MYTQRIVPRRRRRPAAVVAFCAAAGGFALAFAGAPIPDPPVPAEAIAHWQDITRPALADAAPDPDCRCGALRARDLESRVDGHVERWEAMEHGAPRAQPQPRRRLHAKNLVEGVVGFPVRHYRLAADGDGAPGSN